MGRSGTDNCGGGRGRGYDEEGGGGVKYPINHDVTISRESTRRGEEVRAGGGGGGEASKPRRYMIYLIRCKRKQKTVKQIQ